MDGGSGAPGTSNAWHRQRRNKGKGKGNGREGHVIEASAAQLFLNADDTAQESNGGEEELQDYHEAMDDILGSSTSRGKSKDEATAAIANGDSHHHTDLPDSDREHDEGPEDGFVYDGVDDEDTNEFRREAGIIDSEQYKSTLKDILDEDEEGPESSEPLARTELKAHAQSSSGEASKQVPPIPTVSTVPFSPPGSPTPSTASPPHLRSTPQSPYSPDGAGGQPSPRSSDVAGFTRPRLSSNASAASQRRPSHLSPRRPPMNPLVSRLRSTSGAPTLSNSISMRSVSQASSFGGRIDGRNGFADESPSSSFIFEARDDQGASRRSSVANMQDMLSGCGSDLGRQHRNGRPLPPLDSSDLFGTPQSASPSPSVRLTKAVHHQVDPFRWTTLRNISVRMYHGKSGRPSVSGATNLGAPTAIAASGIICVGTANGWVTVFDYSQNVKCVCGNEQIVTAAGRVTALSISSDQTFVAVGHASGHVYLYDLAKPSQPARTVNPVTLKSVEEGKAEGHLAETSEILFLGFVGSRHTAIVSADTDGLAFYHSLGKVLGLANNDVLRILGKYPSSVPRAVDGRSQSASASPPLLAMQPLPLGTQNHPTDDYSLVALLTGLKLVVAGLKPSARTWWRCLNKLPSGIAHGGPRLSDEKGKVGALAWLPSVNEEDPLLAFSWENKLRIVRVEHEVRRRPASRSNGSRVGRNEKDQVVKTLKFHTLSSHSSKGRFDDDVEDATPLYESSSPIHTIQWLNPRSLLLLTSTHLEVFDVRSLQQTDKAPLGKLRSSPCPTLPKDQLIRTYKGKIFFPTSVDLRVGTLLSWADRVLQFVDSGDLIAAIELVVSFYDGSAAPRTAEGVVMNSGLGLPAEDEARKRLVEPKLRDILAASMEYVFSEDRMRDNTHLDPNGLGRGVDRTSLFENLVDATIRACKAIEDFDFLFDELYERYSAQSIEGIFLTRLEPFILDKAIPFVPVGVVQALLRRHEERQEFQQIEDLIWRIKPECLDVNQAVQLCSKHRLYDALIYVYTQALSDFVGPFVELLAIVRKIRNQRNAGPRWLVEESFDDDRSMLEADSYFSQLEEVEALVPDAYLIYAYLADTLVGLSHPSKEPLPETAAFQAKVSLYSFLFSGRSRPYPPDTPNIVRTIEEDAPLSSEPTYPYLRLLLRFDAEATLDCLDIALEDAYLNEEAAGRTPDRQQIINVLLDIMGSASPDEFSSTDRTFLDIFVARNIPKYAQFVQLAQPTLNKILVELASDPDLSSREDRQLAVEFLLSAYQPKYEESLLDLLEAAGFYRVLASIYRSKRLWPRLASVFIQDIETGDGRIRNLDQVLKDAKSEDDRRATIDKIIEAMPQLVHHNVAETAALVDRHMPEEHAKALQKLKEVPLRRMAYLRSLLEPEVEEESSSKTRTHRLSRDQKLLYLSLLCDHDPDGAIRYIEKTEADDDNDDDDEDAVVKILRSKEVFQAIVTLQASKGHVAQSLQTTNEVLQGRAELITAAILQSDFQQRDLSLYTRQVVATAQAAIDVCSAQSDNEMADISTDNMWYSLLHALIGLVHTSNSALRATGRADDPNAQAVLQPVRDLIPQALSALISSTSSRTISFPLLVRRLMNVGSVGGSPTNSETSTSDKTDTTASASYAEYRSIIDSMLETYRFEGDLLETSNRLIAADLYEHVADLAKEKGVGWRPVASGRCEACGRAVWAVPKEEERFHDPTLVAPSASGLEVTERLRGRPSVKRRPSLKGKETDWLEEEPTDRQRHRKGAQSIVVFRGGAACHALCLEQGGRL